jgi:quinol monooxygenase YgiN
MNSSIVLNVIYTVKDGTREKFYNEVQEERIPEMSRLEDGNLKYEYYFPTEDENKILLIEVWKDKLAQDIHNQSDHFKKLQVIKQRYVLDTKLEKYASLFE